MNLWPFGHTAYTGILHVLAERNSWDMGDYLEACVDEIALEGLDGKNFMFTINLLSFFSYAYCNLMGA